MKKLLSSTTVSVGLAIFSMLFGAGNLLYPLKVGITSGNHYLVGILAFLITAVCLPVGGLITLILYDGNYEEFFGRLGKTFGKFCIFLCMLIIGPGLAMPRIITLSHTMTAPFIPIPFLQTINPWSSFSFSIIFLALTFFGSFRKSQIISLLGRYISPTLLLALIIIIVKGIFTAKSTFINPAPAMTIFQNSLKIGYETLDLFGTIFFASIILSAIAKSLCFPEGTSCKEKALVGFQSGLLGGSLLALVYAGINFLGAFHGQGIEYANEGELFRIISFNILTHYGAVIIGTAVFMACYSTAISLAAVVGQYVQQELFKNKIGFVPSLALVLLACIPLSTAGLGMVLNLTAGPLTYVGYPTLIALTFFNFAYKVWGFKPVKIPVLLTFIAMLVAYIYQYL